MGDANVELPDVNTENPSVVSAYNTWVQNFVQEYGIDGLRIDGTIDVLLMCLAYLYKAGVPAAKSAHSVYYVWHESLHDYSGTFARIFGQGSVPRPAFSASGKYLVLT